MKVLAVDTSSSVAAVAVTEGAKLLGEYMINHNKIHSQKLMPMIREIMENIGILPSDIDVYAAAVGPGSFTGLRIGVTAVKAIAYALGKPVVGVPTLDALAYNAPETDSLICPVMDARNNQVYTALYRYEGGIPVRTSEYMGIPITELVGVIKDRSQKAFFVGDGVSIHREFLLMELGDKCAFLPENQTMQRASSVAIAAYVSASRGKLENCFGMAPFYLRKSQAEREYEKRGFNSQFGDESANPTETPVCN